MAIKIIPMSAYDFDFFKSLAKSYYGVDISPIIVDVDLHDYENPKCGNCKTNIRGAYASRCIRPQYCGVCGAKMIWPQDYIGSDKDDI